MAAIPYPYSSASTVPAHLPRSVGHPRSPIWGYHVMTQCLCTTILCVVFTLRCIVRLGFCHVKRSWRLEDWMVSLSFIGVNISSCLIVMIVKDGGGVHLRALPPANRIKVLRETYSYAILYGPFMMCIKISILLMYRRLLVPTRYSRLWYIIQTMIAVIIMFISATTLVKIFRCNPVRKAWDMSVPGHCIDFSLVLLYTGGFNITTDILIVVLPINTVLHLNLSLRKRLAVCATFAIGIVAPVCSILGTVWRVKHHQREDPTYDQSLIALWADAEMTAGIICACLPPLPALFRRRPSSTTREPTASPSGSGIRNARGAKRPVPRQRQDSYFELDDVVRFEERLDEFVTAVRSGATVREPGRQSLGGKKLEDSPGPQPAVYLGATVTSEGENGHYPMGPRIVKTVSIEQTRSD